MKKVWIDCIGEDFKLHICKPNEKVCKCGIKVKNKKLQDKDYEKYYSCYECSY